MKTNHVFSLFIMLIFTEKSFFNRILGFTPDWNYKPTNAIVDNAGVYTSDKVLNLTTANKVHSKCDCIDGDIQNGIR